MHSKSQNKKLSGNLNKLLNFFQFIFRNFSFAYNIKFYVTNFYQVLPPIAGSRLLLAPPPFGRLRSSSLDARQGVCRHRKKLCKNIKLYINISNCYQYFFFNTFPLKIKINIIQFFLFLIFAQNRFLIKKYNKKIEMKIIIF